MISGALKKSLDELYTQYHRRGMIQSVGMVA